MAEVPVTIQCLVYPKNKTVAPFPATIVGYASITGLEVGGGPIEPPPDIPVDPPLVIWGGPIDPYPDIGFPAPQPPLPDKPPTAPEKPHQGWNWSEKLAQWYLLWVPGAGDAQPKRK